MAKLFWSGKGRFRFLTVAGLWLEAALLGSLWWLLALLPWARAVALARGAFGGLGPRLAKHKHVLANLRITGFEPEAGPRGSVCEPAA